jgi:hypothetical protein
MQQQDIFGAMNLCWGKRREEQREERRVEEEQRIAAQRCSISDSACFTSRTGNSQRPNLGGVCLPSWISLWCYLSYYSCYEERDLGFKVPRAPALRAPALKQYPFSASRVQFPKYYSVCTFKSIPGTPCQLPCSGHRTFRILHSTTFYTPRPLIRPGG